MMESSQPDPASLTPARPIPRLGAGLIDLFILFMQYNFVVFFFSLLSLALRGLRHIPGLAEPALMAARVTYWLGYAWSAAVALVYFPYWWQRDGRTFGMRMLKLRVVRAKEPQQRIGVARAVVRGTASLLSAWLLGLGFVWILIDRRGQGWHDKLAGTLVVQDGSRA